MTTSPAGVRTVVVRKLTSSTVPITGAPMPVTADPDQVPVADMPFAKRKKPANRSWMIRWAPKPRRRRPRGGRNDRGQGEAQSV